jgi:hypothetical protein
MLDLTTKTTDALTLTRLTNAVAAFKTYCDTTNEVTDPAEGLIVEDVDILYHGEEMLLLNVQADDTTCRLWVTFAGGETDQPTDVETMTQHFETIAHIMYQDFAMVK